MSLTQQDLQQIREIVQDVVSFNFDQRLTPIENEIKALRNDIKEIYGMIADLQSSMITDKSFEMRSIEEKLLTLNAELLAAAKQAGITLPRQ